VYGYFAAWRDDGATEQFHDLLRRAVRRSRGRAEEPAAVAIDSQSVKSSGNAQTDTVGYDGNKKIKGRRRHGADLGIDVEVVRRDPHVHAFKVLPRRRVVERTFGWFMLHRRLTRDLAGHLTHQHLNGRTAP
jgi:transposase